MPSREKHRAATEKVVFMGSSDGESSGFAGSAMK
jgi:hypothetical protein